MPIYRLRAKDIMQTLKYDYTQQDYQICKTTLNILERVWSRVWSMREDILD